MPKNSNTFIAICLFVTINALFFLKYGLRLGLWAPIVLIPVYAIFCFVVVAKLPKWQAFVCSTSAFRWGTIIAFVSIYVIVCHLVDPQTVQVSRASAINTFLDRLLSGQYPYGRTDHLGNQISGLPGLFIVALPAYFAGDVGYLQPLAFLLFAILSHHFLQRPDFTLTPLVLLGTSPVFLWEVMVRSELFFNMTLVLLAIWVTEIVRNRAPHATYFILSGLIWGGCF